MDELKKTNNNLRDLVQGLRTQFDKLAGSIGREVQGAMSDEMSETLELAKGGIGFITGLGTSLAGFFFKSFTTDRKMLSLTEKQNKMMGAMLAIDKREEAQRRGAMIKKEKSWLSILMAPLFLGAALLGAAIKKLTLPFEALWKVLSPLKMLKSLPGVGKLLEVVKGAANWVMEIVKIKPLMVKAGGYLRAAKEAFQSVPMLGKLFRVLRWGFGKLGLYAQVVFSAFDFIEGFMDTKGDILDKIKGGVKNVIFRFFEFPAMLMGYIWNWIDKTFFHSTSGYQETADRFVAVWRNGLDAVFDFFSVKTFDRAWEGVKAVYSEFVNKFMGMWNTITEKSRAIFDLFFDIQRKVSDFIDDKILSLKKWWEESLPGKLFSQWDLSEFSKPAPEYIPGRSNADYFTQRQQAAEAARQEEMRLLKEQNDYLKSIARSNEKMVDQPGLVNTSIVNNRGGSNAGLVPPVSVPSKGITEVNSAYGY
jgi:hypothetical protein